MLSLRRLDLTNIDVNDADRILRESNGVYLYYESVDNFKENFNKYFLVLEEYRYKIKAIMAPDKGQIFEGCVYIMSEIEDKFNIPITRLFIDAGKEKAISDLADFYFDDFNDGSFELNILNTDSKTPIHLIEWILTSNINCGVNICLDMVNTDQVWVRERVVFDAIYSYVNSFCHEFYIQVVK